jgi:eukaryotic-like serine/threonine-protein kinase
VVALTRNGEPSLGSHGELYCPTCERSYADGASRCPEDGTSLVRLGSERDELIDRDIDGRFTVKERLGTGGMGAVYRAVQHSVGREVAIKIIKPSLIAVPDVAKRFLREAKLTSRLTHPNTVALLDFGQTADGLFYLVMELLAGRTLAQVIEADGAFEPARLVRVGQQICEALDYAHRQTVVHRDLKPSNIFILDGPPGRDVVKVLDFGLAKSLVEGSTTTTITTTNALLGTPIYMSPEAAAGREASALSDLYSLGVILYQLAAGRPPFLGATVQELLGKHMYDEPPPLPDRVPAALGRVIVRLLAKEATGRPASAATLEALLLAAITAPGPSSIGVLDTLPAGEPPARAPRRLRWPFLVAAVGLALGAGGVVWTLRDRAAAPPPAAVAPAPPPPVSAQPPAPEPVAEPPPAPTSADVEIELRAQPAAKVWVDGRLLGETPVTLRLAPDAAPPEVVFRRAGYAPERRRIPARAGVVDVKLRRVREPKPSEGLPF